MMFQVRRKPTKEELRDWPDSSLALTGVVMQFRIVERGDHKGKTTFLHTVTHRKHTDSSKYMPHQNKQERARRVH